MSRVHIYTIWMSSGIRIRTTGGWISTRRTAAMYTLRTGFGPSCQLLDIHRGDRINYLVAMDSKSVNGLASCAGEDGCRDLRQRRPYRNAQQDRAGTHDSPPAQRLHAASLQPIYQLTGTEGFANKYPVEGFAFMPGQISADIASRATTILTASFRRRCGSPYGALTSIRSCARSRRRRKQVGGHGGMDFMMDYRLVYCLQNGLPLDQDVYDAAEWSCIGP